MVLGYGCLRILTSLTNRLHERRLERNRKAGSHKARWKEMSTFVVDGPPLIKALSDAHYPQLPEEHARDVLETSHNPNTLRNICLFIPFQKPTAPQKILKSPSGLDTTNSCYRAQSSAELSYETARLRSRWNLQIHFIPLPEATAFKPRRVRRQEGGMHMGTMALGLPPNYKNIPSALQIMACPDTDASSASYLRRYRNGQLEFSSNSSSPIRFARSCFTRRKHPAIYQQKALDQTLAEDASDELS
jgi:hypothetical protein